MDLIIHKEGKRRGGEIECVPPRAHLMRMGRADFQYDLQEKEKGSRAL